MLHKLNNELKNGLKNISSKVRVNSYNFKHEEIGVAETKLITDEIDSLLENKGNTNDVLFDIIEPTCSIDNAEPLFANKTSGVLKNRPSSITPITTLNGEVLYLIANGGVTVLDNNGSNMGEMLLYSATDKSGFIYRAMQVSVSPDGTKLAVTGYYSQVVDIYSLDIGENTVILGDRLCQFGSHRITGDVKDNKLKYPYGVVWVDDTNLVVSSSGKGLLSENTSCSYEGHLSQLSVDFASNTISLVKTILGSHTTRSFTASECSLPYFIKRFGDIYTVGTDKDEVAELKMPIVNGEIELEINNIYAKPPSVTVTRITPVSSFIVDDNTIAIVSRSIGKIVYLDRNTRDIIGSIGEMFWDDRSDATNQINQFYNPTDMVLDGNDGYLVADNGNNRIIRATNVLTKEVLFDIPSNYDVIKTHPYELDENNKILFPMAKTPEAIIVVYKEK